MAPGTIELVVPGVAGLPPDVDALGSREPVAGGGDGRHGRGLGSLDGKILIDPSNPLRLIDGRFEHSVDTSNTEIIQAVAPGADVVKAFSTINVSTMIDPSEVGGPVSVPLAGNSMPAKEKVADIIRKMGLEPIDVGDARDARWIEGMLILWINNRYGNAGRPPFDYHLRPLPID
jgi:predicted dinucleotide-binding enzyme